MNMEVALIVPVVAWFGLWLWALFDAGSYGDEVWRAAGESKILWSLAIVVLQFFGTLFYLLLVRPKLKAQSGAP